MPEFRIYNTLKRKLWMIEQKRVNKDASQRQIALNFSEKFGRSISPSAPNSNEVEKTKKRKQPAITDFFLKKHK